MRDVAFGIHVALGKSLAFSSLDATISEIEQALAQLESKGKVCIEELQSLGEQVATVSIPEKKAKWKAGRNSALNRVISKPAYTTSRK